MYAIILLFLAGLVLPSQVSGYALINLNVGAVSAESTGELAELNEGEKLVDRVEVKHKQKGVLLALVPITFTVTAIAYADGRVEVKYPWYSRVIVDNKEEVIIKSKAAVSNTMRSRFVGSVRAEGKITNPMFTPGEAEAVSEELERILEESLATYGRTNRETQE